MFGFALDPPPHCYKASLQETNADGVMSAEGALDDPGIFGRALALAAQQRAELKATIKVAKRLAAEAAAGRSLDATERAAVDGLRAAKQRRRSLPAFDSTAPAPAAAVPCDLDLADEYLALAATHRPTLRCVVFHLRRMTFHPLRRFEMRETLENLSLGAAVTEKQRDSAIKDAALASCAALIRRLRDYSAGRLAFVPKAVTAAPTAEEAAAMSVKASGRVAEAAARAKRAAAGARASSDAGAAAAAATTAAAAVAACAAKRASFEQMQRKKAKRQGLPEDHFLKQGRTPPTVSVVASVRAMGETARMAFWREHHGQHCIMHHMSPSGVCEVSRAWGCGFLHEAAV